MNEILRELNIIKTCESSRLRLWQCPPFLFIVLGITTIVTMISTYSIASQLVEEPEMASLIVIFITVIFLVFGHLIISSFNRVVEANKMKTEFISIISHQLRSPLSIFKWTLNLIEQEQRQGKSLDDLGNLMHTLSNTTENMNRLINTLLEVSRIEARTFAIRREETSITSITEEIIRDFKKYAESTNITIVFNPPATVPNVFTDPQRISMAIYNFIDNAIRYTKGSGQVTITIEKFDSSIKWEIKDQGIGIPPEFQKHLFQKFFRAPEGSKIQTMGSGLGLYIAKSIVEASGGTIGFSSEKGTGSTFWFILPIKRSNDA